MNLKLKETIAKLLQIERRTVKDLTFFSQTKSTTVAANSFTTAKIDVSGIVEGYNWRLVSASFASPDVTVPNYWIEGTTVNVVCRSLVNFSITANAQANIMRWKV